MGKKQGNKTYYYLVESARVGGKPRIVSQQYLGSADEIAARLAGTGPGEPARTRHRAFGDLAAVWSMLERLGVADVIDSVVGATGQSNTLTGLNAASTWTVTAADAGSYTSTNTLAFSAFPNLTGGTNTDSFVFSNAATVSGVINGGAGSEISSR